MVDVLTLIEKVLAGMNPEEALLQGTTEDLPGEEVLVAAIGGIKTLFKRKLESREDCLSALFAVRQCLAEQQDPTVRDLEIMKSADYLIRRLSD